LGILAVRLLLLGSPGPHLRWTADPQLKISLRQQSLEPARMPGSLHPYTHPDSFLLQLPIESLGVAIFMVQSSFSALTGFFNKKSNLLKTRVVIYALYLATTD